MPPMSLLLLFFLAIVGGSNAANAANLPPRSEIVPYDQWSCGASEFDKSLSHQLSKEDCPKRMYEADLCCVVHDICYMDEKRSQPECDQDFCHCLSRTVAQAARERNQTSADGCETVSTSFCEIVKLFGGSAYTTARKLADKQKTAMAAWELRLVAEKEAAVAAAEKKRKVEEQTTTTSSTTTASPPSTVSSTSPLPSLRPTTAPTIASTLAATTTTSSPATIGQFITHQFPLDCFGDSLSKCTRQLQQCTSRNFNAGAQSQQPEGDALVLSASLAECSAQFCECASKGLAPIGDRNEATTNRGMLESLGQKKDACHQSLASICSQFQDLPLAVQRPTNVNIWSVNVNYIGQPISLFLAMASSLLLLLLLAVSGLILAKIVALLRRRFRQDESIRKNYAKTSIRRNTLTALRSVSGMNDDDVERGGPHYMPFGHQKDSTVSSPSSSESEAVAQKLLGGGAPSSGGHHHHKKAHSDVAGGQKCNNQQLHNGGHGQKQHLPLNSSQMHLIAGAGNSSTTLSDISSS